MNDLSAVLTQQEKLGVNTRAYTYNQFQQIAKINPSQTQTQMFPDLILNKTEKREMIKSLLKYNPNKAFDNKKIKQIETELKQKFLRKNHSEQRMGLSIINEQKIQQDLNSITEREQLSQSQIQQQYQTMQQFNSQSQLQLQEISQIMPMIQQQKLQKNINQQSGKVLYERLQNQYKDFVVGGQSNYKFYAQKRLENIRNNLSPQNFNISQALSPLDMISNLKSTTNAHTEKAKQFIFDKSSMNKSTQRLGINLPSPLVYKNQIGLINQSQLKRYETVIGKLQKLALRLDLNKNDLSQQRPVLRNFIELHKIKMPYLNCNYNENQIENQKDRDELTEKLIIEQNIIHYVEQRKFLEVNDIIKSLKSIEDHFEYAVNGKIIRITQINDTIDITRNISLNQSQSLNFISQPQALQKDNSSQKIVYNEGCGIALVNEKIGKFDTSTIQYFEQGISLRKVLGYMKVLADIKNYVILEGNLLKIYKFQEYEDGKGKWIVINNLGNNMECVFDCKTLYALAAYQNVIHN